MLRIVLAALVSILALTPFAAAGPIADAHATAIEGVCPSPVGDLGCAFLGAFAGAVGALDDNVNAIADVLGGADPLVAIVDETERAVCGSPSAWNSTQCRQLSGRIGFPGAFDWCAANPPPGNLLGGVLYTAVNAVDNATEVATSMPPFAGTPIEGEHPCHNHWETLRAIAALGP